MDAAVVDAPIPNLRMVESTMSEGDDGADVEDFGHRVDEMFTTVDKVKRNDWLNFAKSCSTCTSSSIKLVI